MSTEHEKFSNRGSEDKKDFGQGAQVSQRQVDEAAVLAGSEIEVDPVESKRVKRKIDWHLLPLMCLLYWVQFMDKTTLGQSAILGIQTATHLNANEYNWLGTVFYISYLVFEYPQNLALQRYPVGKWMRWDASGELSTRLF